MACSLAMVAYGQMFNDIQAIEESLRRIANVRDANGNNRYANVQGSPFLYEQWMPGALQLKGRDTTRMAVTLNMDLASELLLVRLQDGSTGMVSPFSVQWVEIQDEHRRPHRFIVKMEHTVADNFSYRPLFFEVIHEGQYTLLRRIQKRIYTPYAIPYETTDGHREVATIETFWLQKPGETHWHQVKIRPRAWMQTLHEHKEDIRRIRKTQQLNLYDPADVVLLLQWLEK